MTLRDRSTNVGILRQAVWLFGVVTMGGSSCAALFVAIFLFGSPVSAVAQHAKETSDASSQICPTAETVARDNGLPLSFFVGLIWQESRFQPDVVGPLIQAGSGRRVLRSSCHILRRSEGCSIPSIQRRPCRNPARSWQNFAMNLVTSV